MKTVAHDVSNITPDFGYFQRFLISNKMNNELTFFIKNFSSVPSHKIIVGNVSYVSTLYSHFIHINFCKVKMFFPYSNLNNI